MFNIVGYYILQQTLLHQKGWWKILHYTFLGLAGAALLAVLIMPADGQVRSLPWIIFIWLGGVTALGFCFLSILYDSTRSFLWFAITLFVVRFIFDVVVLPIRQKDWAENICRDDCLRLAEKYGDHSWYLYKETFPHEVARFYTSGFTNQIIHKVDVAEDTTAYYLVDRTMYPDFPGTEIDSLILERGQILGLMQVQPYRQ
jgi:hypothetical protein